MASGGGSGLVKTVNTDSDFQKELIAAGEKLVIVDFFASWCAPCKKIAPAFIELSSKYSSAVFLKLDVDVCHNSAHRYEVSSMPTFLFFKNREKIHTFKGADAAGLKSAIIQHLGPIEKEEVEVGNVLHIPGQINLFSLVDTKGCECLNDSDDHPFSNVLHSSPGKEFLESDCDEQLLICITFVQPVKLHSLQIIGPPNGKAPKRVKIFINQPPGALDFDSAEQNTAVQELTLTPEDITENASVPLQYVKFQNVQEITLFIKENQGGEETTVIDHLGFYGSPLDATKMSEFKRVAGEKGERHF